MAGPRPRLLFVCVENSCRSQMAEALARLDSGGRVEALSAGSAASGVVNPGAVRAMAELGYDLSGHESKMPAELPGHAFDVVVSMGCGDRCPTVPAGKRVEWDVPDPKGGDEATFRRTRNDIRARVQNLLREVLEGGEIGPPGRGY